MPATAGQDRRRHLEVSLAELRLASGWEESAEQHTARPELRADLGQDAAADLDAPARASPAPRPGRRPDDPGPFLWSAASRWESAQLRAIGSHGGAWGCMGVHSRGGSPASRWTPPSCSPRWTWTPAPMTPAAVGVLPAVRVLPKLDAQGLAADDPSPFLWSAASRWPPPTRTPLRSMTWTWARCPPAGEGLRPCSLNGNLPRSGRCEVPMIFGNGWA